MRYQKRFVLFDRSCGRGGSDRGRAVAEHHNQRGGEGSPATDSRNIQKRTRGSPGGGDLGKGGDGCLLAAVCDHGGSKDPSRRRQCRRCGRGGRGGLERNQVGLVSNRWRHDHAHLLGGDGEFVSLDAYSKVPSNPELRGHVGGTSRRERESPGLQREPRSGDPRPRGDGVLVSMVPGTAAAWTRAMERYGTKPLSEVFARRSSTPKMGIPSTATQAGSLERSATVMKKYPSSAKIFYPTGRLSRRGTYSFRRIWVRLFGRSPREASMLSIKERSPRLSSITFRPTAASSPWRTWPITTSPGGSPSERLPEL